MAAEQMGFTSGPEEVSEGVRDAVTRKHGQELLQSLSPFVSDDLLHPSVLSAHSAASLDSWDKELVGSVWV